MTPFLYTLLFAWLLILGVIGASVYYFGLAPVDQALRRGLSFIAYAFVDSVRYVFDQLLYVLDKLTRIHILYAATILIEITLGIVRGVVWAANSFVFLFFLYLIFLILEGISWGLNFATVFSSGVFSEDVQNFVFFPSLAIGAWRGFSPIVNSLLAFAGLNSGHGTTRYVLGARRASTREREKLNQALRTIAEKAPGQQIRGFTDYFILDSPFDQVNLIGTTIYLSSGAINSDNLLVLLAHEIGHLNQKDGAKILALRRLVFPLYQMFVGGIREFSTNRANPKPEIKEFDLIAVHYQMINRIWFFWLSFWGGGLGPWLLSHEWASYFRSRDYLADEFVARLGLEDQLIEYLEQTKFFDTSVPYMLGWRPANELRIDHLMQLREMAPVQEEPPPLVEIPTLPEIPKPPEPSYIILLPELEQVLEEIRTLDEQYIEKVLESFGGVQTLDEVKDRLHHKKPAEQERVANFLKKYVADVKAFLQPSSD